jgi:DNA-binding response OmpR family regulator
MKLLLVDDDESILTIFQTTLEKAGFQVVTAANGQSGLEKAKAEKPDFILLDQVLPDIQGNEVLKTLKSDFETKAIPVAMLSNFGQTELVQAAINSGAIDYILKYQIEPTELENKVNELFKESQAKQPEPTTS